MHKAFDFSLIAFYYQCQPSSPTFTNAISLNVRCREIGPVRIPATPLGTAGGNPPVRTLSGEVEISRREFLHEEVKVFGHPDHGGAQARGVWAGCS